MAVTIRDLLPRVLIFRPDLNEADGLFALQEAARQIASESGLLTEVQTPVVLTGGSSTFTVTPTSGQLLRVVELRAASIPLNQDNLHGYLGTWDANTNTPPITDPPDPNVTPTYSFYIVTVSGATSIGGISDWQVGDCVVSYGTAWKRIRRVEYKTLSMVSKNSIDLAVNQPQQLGNFPAHWGQQGNTIYFYPSTSNDLALEVTLSYIPTGDMHGIQTRDISTLQYPMEVEEAIILGALEMLYQMPGAGMNLPMAQEYRRRFLKATSNLKALAIIGVGSAWYRPQNFSGRQGRLQPWRSETWWL